MQFLHTVHCVAFNSFTVDVGIRTYFVYYKYTNCKKEKISRYDDVYQATSC